MIVSSLSCQFLIVMSELIKGMFSFCAKHPSFLALKFVTNTQFNIVR